LKIVIVKSIVKLTCEWIDKMLTCWSEPSWLKASRVVLTFCTLPACTFFLIFAESAACDELPRFFTFGFCVTEGTYLWRVVDDDMLLELLVLVNVLFDITLAAVASAASVDCVEHVEMRIWKGKKFVFYMKAFNIFFTIMKVKENRAYTVMQHMIH
jgi:hypothetical protein